MPEALGVAEEAEYEAALRSGGMGARRPNQPSGQSCSPTFWHGGDV
jgi:hypothetical protein